MSGPAAAPAAATTAATAAATARIDTNLFLLIALLPLSVSDCRCRAIRPRGPVGLEFRVAGGAEKDALRRGLAAAGALLPERQRPDAARDEQRDRALVRPLRLHV